MSGTKVVSIEQQEVREGGEQLKLALACDAILTSFARAQRFSWYEVGTAAKTIKDKELWKRLEAAKGDEAYHGFEDYVHRKMQSGDSTVYRKIQLVEELGTVAREELERIPQCNALWLLKLKQRLGNSKWCNPSIIEKAQTMSEDEFETLANTALPGAAKEEDYENIRIPKSQSKRWQKVKRVLAWKLELPELVDDDRAAIESLGEEFMQSLIEVGAKQSNEGAFDARGKAKKKK